VPRLLVSGLSIGVALLIGVTIGGITCSSSNVLPGQATTSGGVCSFPRGCYVVQKSGPLAGQCDDCTAGGASCRLYFVPTPGVPDPLDLGGVFIPASADLAGADLAGLTLPTPGRPQIVDQPVICGDYPMGGLAANQQAVCANPDTLCIARGVKCLGSTCVRAGGSCGTSVPVLPQRRPGVASADTFCPYSDDRCCPLPPMPDGGMVVSDGGVIDGAAPPDAQHD
jgi:hypothetical protein